MHASAWRKRQQKVGQEGLGDSSFRKVPAARAGGQVFARLMAGEAKNLRRLDGAAWDGVSADWKGEWRR